MADHYKQNPDRRRSRLLRSLAVLGAVVVTSAAFIGGCSDDDDSPSAGREPNDATASTSAERPITTKATVGRIIGRLGKEQKERVKADVSEVVDAFFDNAYLGEFPRTSFDKAYAAFTSGAREDLSLIHI